MWGDIRVDVGTSQTLLLIILKGRFLSHNKAHFENHSRLHLVGKFGRIDNFAVKNHLVVTALDKATSGVVLAETVDDKVNPSVPASVNRLTCQ